MIFKRLSSNETEMATISREISEYKIISRGYID